MIARTAVARVVYDEKSPGLVCFVDKIDNVLHGLDLRQCLCVHSFGPNREVVRVLQHFL
jgi:hypothetical protein